jgi:hypothetical protein
VLLRGLLSRAGIGCLVSREADTVELAHLHQHAWLYPSEPAWRRSRAAPWQGFAPADSADAALQSRGIKRRLRRAYTEWPRTAARPASCMAASTPGPAGRAARWMRAAARCRRAARAGPERDDARRRFEAAPVPARRTCDGRLPRCAGVARGGVWLRGRALRQRVV